MFVFAVKKKKAFKKLIELQLASYVRMIYDVLILMLKSRIRSDTILEFYKSLEEGIKGNLQLYNYNFYAAKCQSVAVVAD